MDIWDQLYDAANVARSNEEIIAEIEANFSKDELLEARLEDEHPDLDLVLEYLVSMTNRRFSKNFGAPMNLEFLSYLLQKGFDVNKKYPGKLMYSLRGYFLDFLKNKDTSLLEFAAMLVREFGAMEYDMQADENGHVNGFARALELIQAAGTGEALVLPDVPEAFGEQTLGMLGFGHSVTVPAILVKDLRKLCLFGEGEASGKFTAVPAGDFSFDTDDEENTLEFITVFLGVLLDQHDSETEIPGEVSERSLALQAFASIQSDTWEKAASMLPEDQNGAFTEQRPAYCLFGNGPLVYTSLAAGELSNSPQADLEFIQGGTQGQIPHSWGVVGKRLLSSSHGELVEVPSKLFEENEKLFLVVQYD